MVKLRLSVFCWILVLFAQHTFAQAPVADFTASTTAGCGPLVVKFSDKSSNNPVSWTWDLGNGTISSSQNPTGTYTNAGTYTVTLIAKNASGATSVIKTDYITVYPFPSVLFSSDLTVACAPATVHFQDQATAGQGTITSWTWNFGDGTAFSNQENPTHQYAQTGYYTVGLTVTNSGGCSNTTTISRYMRVVPGVQPDFSWAQSSQSCDAPFNINFTNQSSGPGTLTYNWDLGNGNTSTSANPTTTYPTSNNYTVKLTTISNYGCSDTISKSISFQTRKPIITAPDSACVGTPIGFANGSSPLPNSSSWDFGDGSTASVTNPSKAFATTGTYAVKLTNDYGNCTSSTTKNIKIVNTPAVSFTSDLTGGCQIPTTINFSDQSTGATGWLWDFGDGTTSTAQNPAHTYQALGVYDVSLTITSGTGCTGTLIKAQYIKIAPGSIDINQNSLRGCINTPIKPLVGLGIVDGVQSYQWSAPGASPSSSTSQTPSFTYTTEGYYNLTLTVVTKGGCSITETMTGKVVIGNPTAAQFTLAPTNVCGHQPVKFVSGSTPVDNWLWNFGDGSTSSAGGSVTHRYSDSGWFNISLTVVHHGCSQSLAMSKAVYVNPPVAGFRYTNPGCTDPRIVLFKDTTIYSPGQTATATYEWNFGDGINSTLREPSHTYADTGVYNVTFIVHGGAGGCSDTIKKAIHLQKIVPAFSVIRDSVTLTTDTICKNSTFTLLSTSTPVDAIDSFSWKIGSMPQTPYFINNDTNVTLPNTGTYNTTLTVLDKGGCAHTSPASVITIVAPTAGLKAPTGGCRNAPLSFIDNSTPYPGYALAKWTLDFGDKKTQTYTSNSSPFTHAYADTGTYNVQLTVTDIIGCADTFRLSVPTRVSFTRAGFVAADTVYCPNAVLPFTDTSQGAGLTWSWTFGDGGTAATQNPTHIYTADSGYYNVSLKITDSVGCSDSVTRNNYIHIHRPVAAFDVRDSAGICIPLPTTFMPHSLYTDSLYWSFGDGTTSTIDTVTHFYNAYRTWIATLYVQGAGGCRDSASTTVTIYTPYSATGFQFSPVKGCDSVIANYSINPPPDTRWTVYFGDNTSDSTSNRSPIHGYYYPATYSPQLVLTDSTGCIVPLNKGSITVLGAVPIFSVNKDRFCDSGMVVFSGTVISNDPPFTVTWDFGDGQTGPGRPTDNSQDTTHYYSAPGIDIAKLTIVTDTGCTASFYDTLHFYQTPHPTISIASGSQCNGLIEFQGGLQQADADTLTWAWTFSNGQKATGQNPAVSFTPGNYTAYLSASTSLGCADSTSTSFNVHALPTISGPKEISSPLGIPVTIPFTYSAGVDTWAWTPATGLSCTDCANPAATPTFPTTYTVTVTDSSGCTATDSITVKTICNTESYFIPNTFSPNNDGVNDVFYPRGAGIYNIQAMRVFNRWGQMVFERKNFPANSAAMGWDGNFNGHAAPADVYVYIVEVICNNAQIIALKGDVTLVR